jgi:2-polyprenyl-3-methyl-5-hydroxy-6-metoxy-1,4-benzoquinol methylase
MKITSCPVCSGNSFKFVSCHDTLSVEKCQSCGFLLRRNVDTSGIPADAADPIAYCGWAIDSVEGKALDSSIQKIRELTFDDRLDHIEKYIKAGKVLDIGCATGFFLKREKERGWQTFGVEISKTAGKKAQEIAGGPVFIGTLENAGFSESFFDVITMFDVVEHAIDLDSLLTHVRKLLKPQGMIFITTPNIESLTARLMGSYWPHYNIGHVYYFSPETLTRLLKKYDLTVKYITPAKKVLNLEYFHNSFKLFKNRMLGFISSIAVWVLPNKILKKHFTVSVGEMLVAGYNGATKE